MTPTYALPTPRSSRVAIALAPGRGAQVEGHGGAPRAQPGRLRQAEDLLQADGYIFVTPENLASMAGVMKDFFDRTYYAVLERITGRHASLT